MSNVKENNASATCGDQPKPNTVLFIEAYYGGSHKQMLDTLRKKLDVSSSLVSMTAKKWQWRARCSAIVLATLIPPLTTETVLFTSSVVNLAELLGLRPDLRKLKKIVYFHENQLVYPVQTIKQRDIQYAYNQIVTCLVADVVVFNSIFNMESFVHNINKIMKLLPDYRPTGLQQKLTPKCKVLYFPMDYPFPIAAKRSDILTIVWPHRWEFDKNPEALFRVLYKLKEYRKKFLISVLGEVFTEMPEIFRKARYHLRAEIINFGFIESKDQYFKILSSSHIVVSTALHEFFGVSVLEATYLGCFPIVPNQLVYPEIYPPECLYESEEQLYEMLSEYSDNPPLVLAHRKQMKVDFDLYSVHKLLPEYRKLLEPNKEN